MAGSARAVATSALLLLTACDPNVVIGTVFKTDGGGGGASAGNGGTVAAGGTSADALLFEARHELDQSEWTSDGDDNGYLYCPDALARVTRERAHSGSGSLEISIDTANGATPVCQMLRRTPAPRAYYGAWFFTEQAHDAIGWWTIFFFKTKTTSHWDLGMYHDGHTSFALYDHARDDSTPAPSEPQLPVGRWFHLEAYLAYGQDTATEIEVWLDGTSLLRVTTDPAPTNEALFWGLGNEGSELSPSNSSLYIDDATISSRRLGP